MKLSIERTISTEIEIRFADYTKLVAEGFAYVPLHDVIHAGDFVAVNAPDAVRSNLAGEVRFTNTVYAVVFNRHDRALLYLMKVEK